MWQFDICGLGQLFDKYMEMGKKVVFASGGVRELLIFVKWGGGMGSGVGTRNLKTTFNLSWQTRVSEDGTIFSLL